MVCFGVDDLILNVRGCAGCTGSMVKLQEKQENEKANVESEDLMEVGWLDMPKGKVRSV